jgi:hypothetical protein
MIDKHLFLGRWDGAKPLANRRQLPSQVEMF